MRIWHWFAAMAFVGLLCLNATRHPGHIDYKVFIVAGTIGAVLWFVIWSVDRWNREG